MQKLLTARWKGWSVMTLKELRESVENPRIGLNYQIIRKGKVFLWTFIDGAELIAYKNGYIVYCRDNRTATFPVTDCASYTYYNTDGSISVIPAEEFDYQDWTIRALLEGEDRVENNIDKRKKEHELGVSEGDSAETMLYMNLAKEEMFVDPSPSWEDLQIEKELLNHIHMAIDALLPKQRELIKKRYLEGKKYKEIADDWNCSVKAVQKVEKRTREMLLSEIKNFF